MGSCVSTHKTSQSTIEPKPVSESQAKNSTTVVDTEYPVSEKGSKPQTSSILPLASTPVFKDSKDDLFFDSQAYLDSDCEDFVSVSGDFASSCGSSPLHPSIPGTPRDKSRLGKPPGPVLDYSPTDKKKRLLEFFHDGEDEDDTVGGNERLQGRVPDDKTFVEKRSPIRGAQSEKMHLSQSKKWHLRSAIRRLTSNERRMNKGSPMRT